MRRFLLSSIVILTALTASAKSWIDVTSAYIKNPNYDNNSLSYWEGTTLGQASPKENAEHYSKNYDTYQRLTGLTPGTYRLSLNAFYRMGDSSNDYSIYKSGNSSNTKYAQLYATSSINDYYTQIQCASEGMSTSQLGGSCSGVGGTGWGWNQNYVGYIPNNMEAAYYWFEAGYYKNTVECEVGSDGVLTIGIRKSTTIDGDWTCIDSWKLEYYGDVIYVTSVKINETSISMVESETKQLTATVQPADATYQTVTWDSSDKTVATVDDNGLVTALKVGTTDIAATSTDGKNLRGICTVKVIAPETATAENLIINEIMSANVDVYRDPSTNFGSWVEVYNPGDKGVKLGGLYVTDDKNDLKKYPLHSDYGAIGAHGFALLNFDHFTNFTKESYRQLDGKLDCDGGTICITDGSTILAEQTYPEGISRVSYARKTDGGDEWGYTGNPTPGASNATSEFAVEQLEKPEVSADGQLFSGSISFSVTIPDGATLRYTTDGSAPTLSNGETSENGQFTTDQSTCYRFRLFKDGYLPSSVATRSFIQDSGNEPFPIISLTTADGNIFNGDMAIFSNSSYGRPGNGQSGNCNWNMDWDRPVNFEYITTDNKSVINQECNFSCCGGWSRAWEPHSFKLKASKEYEQQNSFDYQFFANKPYVKHKVLQIRNGGNDNWCRIKDAALQEIVRRSGLYVECQSWQPVHVYLNGQSYGVLNMREPNNKDYGQTNYGIDTDEMDQFEISPDSGYVQMKGTKEAFNRWYTLAKTASNAASYAEIEKIVDIDEYINYMAVELYYGSDDWPKNNIKAFRDIADGKFRFTIFDLDASFDTTSPFTTFFNHQNWTFDSLYGYDYSTGKTLTGSHMTKEIELVTIFKNMLNNATFRKKFIDAFCLVAGSVVTPERVKSIVDEMSSYLSQGGYVYPSSTANTITSKLTSSYQTNMIKQLKSCSSMNLSSTTAQSVTLASNISDAGILLNGTNIPTGKFSGQLFAPITLKAQAPAGYEFAGWSSPSGTTTGTTVFSTNSAWKYYDGGSLDSEDWKSATYSDSSWGSGNAPLGYGKSTITTTTAKNLSCYYFRKSFDIINAQSTDSYTLNYTIDDGFVLYVNGQEAGRYNMPSGTTSYSTAATTYANDNPDTGSMTIDGSLFNTGTNVIAVEVHNNQPSSSDIVWNAELIRSTQSEGSVVSINEEYTLPTSGSFNLVATWTKIEDKAIVDSCAAPIKINEVSASNNSFVNEHFKKDDWVELYNTTDQEINVAGLYLSDNTKKPQKYQISQLSTQNSTLSTIIPAHGHLIVWCSKRDQISQIHASFKLGNDDGSVLMLSSSEEFVKNNQSYFDAHPEVNAEFADTIHYNAMAYDQTVGRYPDGSNNYYLMNRSTIGSANTLISRDTYIGTDVKSSSVVYAAADVNRDGQVDIADVNATISVITMSNTQDYEADVNGDGDVDIADVNAIIAVITNQN